MKLSTMLIPTLKETPKDAEAKSHIVMLRSGMIRKLASGFYSYLPLGFRVLQKVEKIVREEMDTAGAQELLMPALHPAELWKKTGRYDVLQDILMKVEKDDREYVLGPTHEEIITELATAYIKSYKDMPVTLYQIQTKFRDEARPRFGVIRSREFIMKDAYSFDRDAASLDKSYEAMYQAYKNIFTRCGLDYVAVQADPGPMGGNFSHEFMVLVDFGEDKVAICKQCGYAASTEVAACKSKTFEAVGTDPRSVRDTAAHSGNGPYNLEYISTPNVKTIDELTSFLKLRPTQFVKTILYKADNAVIACLVRGDHEICNAKIARFLKAAKLELADEETIKKVTGAEIGFAGPVGLKGNVKIIADSVVAGMNNFITGANRTDQHIKNVNPGQDFKIETVADIRVIVNGDACPECGATIVLQTSLEIGHVFKLGTKCTKAFNGMYLDQDGAQKEIIMGCYGIGVNRIVAACIEQNYTTDRGMVWPVSIAPFSVTVITANQTSEPVVAVAEQLYSALTRARIDVLYDDRDERMGVKFNDAELIGSPLHIVIGDKGLKEGKLEVRDRRRNEKLFIPANEIEATITQLLK